VRARGETSGRRRLAGRAARLVWLLAALGAVWLLAAPPAVLAHAEVVGVEPAPGVTLPQAPDAVRLRLTEPVEGGIFVLQVSGPGGERVDRRDARLTGEDGQTLEVGLRDGGNGPYTVSWRVLSTDGHVAQGRSGFGVGAAAGGSGGAAVSPGDAGADAARAAWGGGLAWDSTLRWLTYLAVFFLVGGLAAGPLILWPALAPAGAGGATLTGDVWRRRRRVLALAWGALLLLGLVSLLTQASELTGLGWADAVLDGIAARLVTQTRYGQLWLARMGLVLAILAVLAVAWRRPPRTAGGGPGRRQRLAEWIGFEIGALYLLALAAGGHASAGAMATPLAVGLDWLHLLAGTLWIGGLLQLVAVLAPALRAAGAGAGGGAVPGIERGEVLGAAGRRLTRVAVPAVAVLLATGLYAGRRYLPDWDALTETPYGAALSTKLLLVIPLLALGGAAFWSLRAGRPGAGGLRRLVPAESLLAALVLGATGVLAGLPPATSAPGPGRPFAAVRWIGDERLLLTVVPNTAGVSNRITVTLEDAAGRAVTPASVTVTLEPPADSGATRTEEVVSSRLPTGHYPISALLTVPGQWRAEVRLPGAAAPVGVDFRVGQLPGAGPEIWQGGGGWATFSPLRILLLAPRGGLLAGAALLVAGGAVGVVRARRPGALARLPGVTGTVCLALGAFLLGSALAGGYRLSVVPPTALPAVNPVPATGASFSRGELVYRQSCLSCHGVAGRGDGPAGAGQRPPPADLGRHMVAGHTDGELYTWVTDGIPGTAMPGFGDRLSAEDRWDAINYIRRLGDVSAVTGAPLAPARGTPEPAGSSGAGPAGAAGAPATSSGG
jgi:copper transport protein